MRRGTACAAVLVVLVACAPGRSELRPAQAPAVALGNHDVVITVENRTASTAYIYRRVGELSRILVATVPARHTDRMVFSSEVVGVNAFIALDEGGRYIGSERVRPSPNSPVIIRRELVERGG